MRRKIVLSDEMIEVRLQEHEKLRYRTSETLIGHWEAEIIGPFDSPYYGTTNFGSDKSRAVSGLIGRLRRSGFIGRLVEQPITGRGPHTDLVDHDPLSDDCDDNGRDDTDDRFWDVGPDYPLSGDTDDC